jgi:hypothetical protein
MRMSLQPLSCFEKSAPDTSTTFSIYVDIMLKSSGGKISNLGGERWKGGNDPLENHRIGCARPSEAWFLRRSHAGEAILRRSARLAASILELPCSNTSCPSRATQVRQSCVVVRDWRPPSCTSRQVSNKSYFFSCCEGRVGFQVLANLASQCLRTVRSERLTETLNA